MADTDTPDTITVTIPITRDHRDFMELLTGSTSSTPKGEAHCGDVLIHGFSGYWLRGVTRDPELGWLCYDFESFWNDRNASDSFGIPSEEDEVFKPIVAAWRAGEELPEHVYRLDRAAALRALQYAVERWGLDFYDNTDYGELDCAVQHALLGEVIYG